MASKKTLFESHYQTIRKVGEGEQGAVYLVQKRQSIRTLIKQDSQEEQQLYAMKKIPLSKHYFDFEAKLLLSLSHPNVIQVKEVFQDKQFLVLILELAQEGDLHQYIKRNYFQKVPEQKVVSWLCQLCLGLYYLHNENNIIHRDIKSRNVLVKQNGLLKLADFGVAKKLQKGEDFAKTSVGTPCYLSPESINLGKYDNKSDVWSLGCLLYEICTGQKPFKGQSLGTLLHNIVNNEFGQIPSRYSPWLRELIKSMLQKDHLKRPNIMTLLEDPQIKKQFKVLKQTYPEYQKILYPEEGPKTTKYLDIDDKKLNCLKIFSESLKTTKNERSIKLQVENKNSGSDSSLNKEKTKDMKRMIYTSSIDLDTKTGSEGNRLRVPEKKIMNEFFQVKKTEVQKVQKQEKRAQFIKPATISSSLNKINSGMTILSSNQTRKVERDKFLDKSLKSIIANRARDKIERNSTFKKD